jgi:hypothetical protein
MAALATGATLRAAAKAVGINERTARRRWADPAFQRQVRELRAVAVERASGRLSCNLMRAVNGLRQLLDAEGESIRLGACRAMLELGMKLRQEVDLEQRIAALEARAAASEAGKVSGR